MEFIISPKLHVMENMMDFGVLTLATKADYKKAIGLSLSLKMTTPGIPISIVCSREIALKVRPYFDQVIYEKKDLKGFEHKIFLDHYTPYNHTFFFDADVLIFKNIIPMYNDWKGSVYAARGTLESGGISSFGLDRKLVLKKINKNKFSVIDGAGHAYFEKPKCAELFETARNIMKNYSSYANPCRFADEDVMGIAMTLLDIEPKQRFDFLGMPWHAIPGTLDIDITKPKCIYQNPKFGRREPYMMHFPRKAIPFTYARELSKLFKMNNVKTNGLWIDAVKEKFIIALWWPLLEKIKKMKKQ